MDEQFIRERISALRIQKGVSEYKMSVDLGHSKSYIQSISTGRALPSMTEFLYICEYLGVTPQQFFDQGNNYPASVNELLQYAKSMKKENVEILLDVAKRFI